jgi:hypothetical protein
VRAIEKAVRFYESPPTEGMTVTTPWGEVELTAADWAEAFSAAEPGTPHNEAREQIWDELVSMLQDRVKGEVPAILFRRALAGDDELTGALGAAWPMIEAADLVGDLWTVPAYLRLCAPWLAPEEVRLLRRTTPDAWTVSDLPLLDAARQRLGDPGTAVRKRRHKASVAAERERMAGVIDSVVAADPDGEGAVTMLMGEDLRQSLVDESALPSHAATRWRARSRTSWWTRRRS